MNVHPSCARPHHLHDEALNFDPLGSDFGSGRASRVQCLCLPQVAIMTPDMASFQTVEEAAYSQDQDDIHPVTLLATSNGTHIAVQVGRQTPC